jgi:sugar phosphate isomerase/epimerase
VNELPVDRLIGYIAADTRGMPPAGIAAQLSAHGYDAVDWTMEQFDPIEQPASQLTGLVSLAADHGLSVRQLMVHQDYVVDDQRTWEQRVRRTELALEAAAEAGIPTIGVLTGPNRWEPGHAEIGHDISEDRAWSRALEALERVLRRAEDLGSVQVCLEPCWGTLARDRYRAEYALARLPSERLGLNLDPSHFVMSGDDVADFARAWGKRIGHVHLKDAFGVEGDPGQDFIFLLPGEGSVRWAELFAALDEVAYAGAMSVEFEAFALLDGPLRGDVGAGMRLARELVRGLIPSAGGA